MNRDVINDHAALLHHLLYAAQVQRVGHIPAHAHHHQFDQVMKKRLMASQSVVSMELWQQSCRARIAVYPYRNTTVLQACFEDARHLGGDGRCRSTFDQPASLQIEFQRIHGPSFRFTHLVLLGPAFNHQRSSTLF